jgi:hypothetical protein
MSEQLEQRAAWAASSAAMARIDAAAAETRIVRALDDYCAVTGLVRSDALAKLLRASLPTTNR